MTAPMPGVIAARIGGWMAGDRRTARFGRWAVYGLGSVGALAVDVAVMLSLVASGLSPTVAGVLGYGAGIGAHWWWSSRLVFTGRVALRATRAGRRQRLAFLGSALGGMASTGAVMSAGVALGFGPLVAKALAVVVSFQLVWWLRGRFVFGDDVASSREPDR